MQIHFMNDVLEYYSGWPDDAGYEGAGRRAIQLVESLEQAEGPAIWLRSGGHVQILISLFDHPPVSASIRSRWQIQVDPRDDAYFCRVRYLLPVEEQPWTDVSGDATTVEEAVALILEAIEHCEKRREFLDERLA